MPGLFPCGAPNPLVVMFAIFVATGGSQRPLFEPGAPATHSSTFAVLEDGAEEVPSAVIYIYIYIYICKKHT